MLVLHAWSVVLLKLWHLTQYMWIFFIHFYLLILYNTKSETVSAFRLSKRHKKNKHEILHRIFDVKLNDGRLPVNVSALPSTCTDQLLHLNIIIIIIIINITQADCSMAIDCLCDSVCMSTHDKTKTAVKTKIAN